MPPITHSYHHISATNLSFGCTQDVDYKAELVLATLTESQLDQAAAQPAPATTMHHSHQQTPAAAPAAGITPAMAPPPAAGGRTPFTAAAGHKAAHTPAPAAAAAAADPGSNPQTGRHGSGFAQQRQQDDTPSYLPGEGRGCCCTPCRSVSRCQFYTVLHAQPITARQLLTALLAHVACSAPACSSPGADVAGPWPCA